MNSILPQHKTKKLAATARLVPLGILALFLLLTTHSNAQKLSGKYTICTSGCDYSTISDAVSDLTNNGISAPVTFDIAGGSYNEQIYFSSAVSGASATNTITFNGVGSSGSGTSVTRIYYSNSYPLYLSKASYFNFNNIIFENTGTTSYAADLYYASYNRFNNCQFKAAVGSKAYCMYNYYSSNTYINNCRFYGGYYGLYKYQSSSATTNDTIKNCSFVQFGYYGVYQYYGKGNYFYKNRIDSGNNNNYNLYTYREGYGTYEDNYLSGGGNYNYMYYSDHMTFNKNKFGDGKVRYQYCYYNTACTYSNNEFYGTYYGLYVAYPNYSGSTDPMIFVNNTFTVASSGYYGCYMYDYSSNSAINTHILHNTFYMTSSGNYCFGINNYNASSGWDIRNNNFYADNSSSSLNAFTMTNIGSNDVESGNNFYKPSGSGIIIANGVSYSSVADYQAAVQSLGLGMFDQSVQTVFKNAPEDLRYASTSPLPWGKGITSPITVDKDIDGDSRCKQFATSGADEGNPTFTKPNSKFTAPKMVVDGSPALFKNSAKPSDPAAFKWYVNGKFITDSIHLFTTALKAPSADVTLVSENCAGKDSVTFTYKVDSPKKAPISDFIADKNSIRAGEVVKIKDLSPNFPSDWSWDISPKAINMYGMKIPAFTYTAGDSTKPNIEVRFDYPGKYKVCLTTKNIIGSGGTECKTAYIAVLGTYNMSTNLVIRETSGYLYDDGGPQGKYTSYKNTTALIDPGCAKNVYLIFNKFDTYCGYGYVRIWDGEDAKGTELTPCTTNTLYGYGPGLVGGPSSSCYQSGIECIPAVTDTFKATSGKMYITMQANYNNNMPGFEAYFWSDPKPQVLPKASFTMKDTVCTNESVDFINTSTGDDLQYMWDMDGDLSYFEANTQNTDWPFIFPGNYTITLIAKNCSGIDTFQKSLNVVNPPKPVVAFHADNLNPTSNDIVFLMPDIEECVEGYKWKVSKKYGTGNITFVNGTTEESEIAQVMLNDTGCYNVTLVAENLTGNDSSTKDCYIFVKNPYCVPTVENTIADLGISEVKLNTLDAKSKQTGTYENYTSTANTTLEIGVSYPFEISRSTSANKAVRAIYIDWNGDGDFKDSMELVAYESTAGRNLVWTDTLTVPAFAKTGATVLRAAITQGALSNDPCANSFGEYEDYRIYITQDQTPPVITLNGADTIKVEQGYLFTDPGATASDNLSGNVTSRIKVDKGGFDILTSGTYLFSYNVKDDAGNAAKTAYRVVIVEPDKTKPDLSIDAMDTLIYVGVFTPFTLPSASAWDLVDGDLTADIKVNNTVDVNVVDTYTVTYQVTDNFKNTSMKALTVIVQDTSAPVLTMIGSSTMYVDVHSTYTDSGVDIMDNYYMGGDWDSIMKTRLQTVSTVNTDVLGSYSVTYDLTDPSGNVAKTLVRIVIVQDTMAPTIVLNGDAVLHWEVNIPFTDPYITIQDNHYKEGFTVDTLGNFYTTFPDAMPTMLGTYTIIYEVSDPSDNKSTIQRTVIIEDTEAPIITLVGSPTVNACRWSEYTDAGYKLSDYDTNITPTMEGSFVDNNYTSQEGIYSFRYKAEDASGNVGYSDWRTINVLSPGSPECYDMANGIDSKELSRFFNIYPNPTSGKFVIESHLPTNISVRIVVTNLLGQEIKIDNNQVLGKGHTIIDLSNQTSGIYLINIYTPDNVITKRVMVNK